MWKMWIRLWIMMNRFKAETMKDYTAWDLDCPYNSKSWSRRNNKLKSIFKRKARRKLKKNLCKQIQKNEC